jgi:hypothetical protein
MKMTKQYNLLLDHVCAGAEEWSNRGNLYYEFGGCDCSPQERWYKFDWYDETYDVKFCPACGAKMKENPWDYVVYDNAPKRLTFDIAKAISDMVNRRTYW